MGITDQVGAGLGAVGAGMEQVGMTQIKAAVEAERIARLSELRKGEEVAREGRAVTAAATERARIDTEARRLAGQRRVVPESVGAQTDASAIALEEADRAGTLPPGVKQQGLMGLSAYANDKAVPDTNVTDQDMLRAQGKYEPLMADKRAERTADDARSEHATDNIRADRQLALQEKQFGRASELTDIQVKTATLQYERLQAENKVPVAVTKQYATLSEAYTETNKIIAKSRADGTFNDVTAAPLLAEQAARADKMSKLLDPYVPVEAKGGGAAAGLPPKDVARTNAMKAVADKRISPEAADAQFEKAYGEKLIVAKDGPRKPDAKVSETPKADDVAPRGILNRARNAQPAIDMQAAESLRSIIEAKLRTKQPLTPREDAAAKTLGLL